MDDYATSLQKLEESYGVFKPPLTLDDQMALLFAYRRVLHTLLVKEEAIKRKDQFNGELNLMIQEWIIDNPTRNKDHW